MFKKMRFKAVVLLALFAIFCTGYLAGSWLHPSPNSPASSIALPDVLNADAASGGESLSLATGWIGEDVEGLFVLDHLTGTLYCWVLNPRTGALAASYETNVKRDLVTDTKKGDFDFVMTTGSLIFKGGRTGNLEPANTVVYVGEGNSGKIAAYSLLYSEQINNAGVPLNGQLERIAVGQTRASGLLRDQGN